MTRKLAGAGLGVLAGTAALAAQVADGDLLESPGKALGEVAATTVIGYTAGSNFIGNRLNNVKDAKAWMDKKTLGIDEYNNREFDRQFYKSEGYKSIVQDEQVTAMCDAAGIPVREAVQSYLNNGITDPAKIKEALQNGVGGDTYKAYEKAEGIAMKDIPALANAGIGASEYNMFKGAGIKDASKMEDIVRKHGGDIKAASRNAAIANKAKDLGITGKYQFIQYVKNYGGLSDSEAEKLYNQMSSFWS